ncbi:MAG: Ig-like domain-containing protein [Bacteroidota bacterium]
MTRPYGVLLVILSLLPGLLPGCKENASNTLAPDADPPAIAIVSPSPGKAVGDTLTIRVNASDNTGVARVEFSANGVNISGVGVTQPPFTLVWVPQGIPLGDTIRLAARALDQAGNARSSDTVRVLYKWFRVMQDPDETWPRDIRTVYARSTTGLLEFRVEMNGSWTDPHVDTAGIDCALFLDTDRNPATGLSPSLPLYDVNDIGPEYVAVVGVEGDSLWIWPADSSQSQWRRYRDFASLTLQANTFWFEVALRLADIGNPSMIDIVAANITFGTGGGWDWAPDQGHITYLVEPNYTGGTAPPHSGSSAPGTFAPGTPGGGSHAGFRTPPRPQRPD